MQSILTLSQWKTRVNDHFSMVTLCKMNHADMMDRQQKYIDSEMYRKWSNGRSVYSSFDKGYIRGMIELHIDMLYRFHLEFCYVDQNGNMYSTNKNAGCTVDSLINQGKGHLINNMKRGHFWRDTDKRFY